MVAAQCRTDTALTSCCSGGGPQQPRSSWLAPVSRFHSSVPLPPSSPSLIGLLASVDVKQQSQADTLCRLRVHRQRLTYKCSTVPAIVGAVSQPPLSLVSQVAPQITNVGGVVSTSVLSFSIGSTGVKLKTFEVDMSEESTNKGVIIYSPKHVTRTQQYRHESLQ